MVYRVIVSSRAQKEIENAIDYYALYSDDAPVKFLICLKETYDILSSTPFFKVHYKNVRALKIKKFPYSLYFVVKEDERIVRVLSCFHNKRHPGRRPIH